MTANFPASVSHAIAGAIGAAITLGLFACLSASRTHSDAASSIRIQDAAGRSRIYLGENSDRLGSYCLEFYSEDGKTTTFQLTSSDRGTEAAFFDRSGKTNIWLDSAADQAAIHLLSNGLGVVELGADKTGQGRLGVYKTEETTIQGRSATVMHPEVVYPK